MINLSILISSSEISGPGGLFDFNATLPLIAIQFLLAILILNAILYNPLLTIIEERKKYILTTLKKAGELLAEANKLTAQYEEEFDSLRQESLVKSTNSKKMYQATFQSQLNLSQVHIDSLLSSSIQHLIKDKNRVLKVSDGIVKSSVDYIVKNKLNLPGLLRTKK
jgi:F-type H+-transporting ATPase subunit b